MLNKNSSDIRDYFLTTEIAMKIEKLQDWHAFFLSLLHESANDLKAISGFLQSDNAALTDRK